MFCAKHRWSTLFATSILCTFFAGCDDVVKGVAGQLLVKPAELVFRGAAPQETPYELALVLQNVGSGPLRITGLALAGDEHFSLVEAPSNILLQPRQQTEVVVQFLAEDMSLRSASIRIESTDNRARSVVVPVRNDPVAPRLVVSDCVGQGGGLPTAGNCVAPTDDGVVDFGTVPQGMCRRGLIVLENVGPARLKVELRGLRAGANTAIRLLGNPPPAVDLGPVADDGATEKFTIEAEYCPRTNEAAEARLDLESTDPAAANVEVLLRGQTLGIGGPTCTCAPAVQEVAPQTPMTFTANCTDPDGDPLQYRWSLVARPPGSTETPNTPNSRTTAFTPNTATTPQTPYILQVTATDPSGRSGSCQHEIYAVPRDALHLQLVWDTADTDLDLHLLNPQGRQNPFAVRTTGIGSNNDCYFANTQPMWGTPGRNDDPSLDLDDVTGFGPENINVATPASGTYQIGVHYFSAGSGRPTRATVRVFCSGIERAVIGPQTLTREGDYWQVADIVWPGCAVTPLSAPLRNVPPQSLFFP